MKLGSYTFRLIHKKRKFEVVYRILFFTLILWQYNVINVNIFFSQHSFAFFLLVVSLLVLKIIVLNVIQTFKTAEANKTTPYLKYGITDLIHIVCQQKKVYGRSLML